MTQLSPITINSFDISYYAGLTAKDVIPELITKLKTTFAKLDKTSNEYKAIQTYIRLLNTYLTMSDSQNPEANSILSFFNELSEYLQKYVQSLYPEYDIYIKPEGRIKSPISANKKIKQKIATYLKEGKDLDTLNISDFIAFKFIVDVRNKFGNLVPEEKSVEICYFCTYAAIEYIKNHQSINLMKVSRIPSNTTSSKDIYIPSKRPSYIEEFDDYIKDFMFSPKQKSNYQSVHMQFHLSNTKQLFSSELQFKTFLMNEYAERGQASHKKYKTRKKISFLAIPQMLRPKAPYSQQLEFINPDEAFKEHLGFSPQQIHPSMSFDYLKKFLEDNNYSHPIFPLYFKENEKKEPIFFDDLHANVMPLEIISLDNQEEMSVLVGDIFDERNFEHEVVEHEFI